MAQQRHKAKHQSHSTSSSHLLNLFKKKNGAQNNMVHTWKGWAGVQQGNGAVLCELTAKVRGTDDPKPLGAGLSPGSRRKHQ